MQVDNRLFGALRPVLLYMSPLPTSPTSMECKPALVISVHKMPSNSHWNADIYRHLIVSLHRITMQIEERLLWKLLQFLGFNKENGELDNLDENNYDSQRSVLPPSSLVCLMTSVLPPSTLCASRGQCYHPQAMCASWGQCYHPQALCASRGQCYHPQALCASRGQCYHPQALCRMLVCNMLLFSKS